MGRNPAKRAHAPGTAQLAWIQAGTPLCVLCALNHGGNPTRLHRNGCCNTDARQGLGVAEIGAFVGSLYLPWAFKWAFGPIVDTNSSDKYGRCRLWIVLAQVMMITTLMAALPVNFTTEVKLFTFLILLHNIFGATQDVAINALAAGVLKQEERGLTNGLMFGGAYLG